MPFPVGRTREFPLMGSLINFFVAKWGFEKGPLRNFA